MNSFYAQNLLAYGLLLAVVNGYLNHRLISQRHLVDALGLLPVPRNAKEYRDEALAAMRSIDRQYYCKCGLDKKVCTRHPYADKICIISASPKQLVWSPSMHMSVLERAAPYIHGKAKRKVLHVGCDAGYLTSALYKMVGRESLIYATDPSKDMVRLAKRNIRRDPAVPRALINTHPNSRIVIKRK